MAFDFGYHCKKKKEQVKPAMKMIARGMFLYKYNKKHINK